MARGCRELGARWLKGQRMVKSLGVGFIGGGQATQAIHLPVLAKLGDRFRVARVMDVDAATAANVAARCGARVAASMEEVCADPKVEVVTICSPNAFHAEQAIAACRAGKRLVLIEKPLAATRPEGLELARVARETGTQIVIGAMHVYDPAYRAAHAAWAETGDEASHVHSAIFLPTNDHFINQATDLAPLPAPAPRPKLDLGDVKVQVAMLRNAVLGLAIHNLPLIRAFAPTIEKIESARFIPPFGYEISFVGRDRSARLLAMMPGEWPPHWTLRAMGRAHELAATFPPSYVLAGSSRCEVRSPDRILTYEHAVSGYEAMWRHAHALALGEEAPIAGLDAMVADFDYALDLADGIDAFLGAAR
jgi:myo-inositol 2-dehydrogenase / D-chiro-inositol 1-dehydrogenase